MFVTSHLVELTLEPQTSRVIPHASALNFNSAQILSGHKTYIDAHAGPVLDSCFPMPTTLQGLGT